jgi:hypothetical protein
MRLVPALTSVAVLLLVAPAQAADRWFAGTWRIEKALTAPWAHEGNPPDPEGPARLVGRSVTFAPEAVRGPAPLGCSKAVYATRQDGPEVLFQGMLDETARRRGGSAAAVAGGLGMTSPTVPTLDPGCSPIEYHLIEPGTLAFGLDNVVYLMRRVGHGAAAPAKRRTPRLLGAVAGSGAVLHGRNSGTRRGFQVQFSTVHSPFSGPERTTNRRPRS